MLQNIHNMILNYIFLVIRMTLIFFYERVIRQFLLIHCRNTVDEWCIRHHMLSRQWQSNVFKDRKLGIALMNNVIISQDYVRC